MRVSEKLIERLRKEGLNLPDGSRLIRSRAGQWQRKRGAWSWWAEGPDVTPLEIGSCYSMAELLNAKTLHISTELDETSIFVQER